ncbi:hypothetical protein [Actinoplanes sp. NPDC089786]|uniref:hypothetical protein n=1 Tax=Actinoplanes sp. NPDC089786 TaxID=3155185 RepID=UPI003441FDDA
MIIPGYPSRFPLVDGNALITDELFWPAYLSAVGGSATAPQAFATDPADLDGFLRVLESRDVWPVLTLPMAGHARLHIVMRNLPDDAGTDYVLESGDRSFTLAALEGGFRGPALSWAELVATAGRPDPARSPAERLLLLLPASGDVARDPSTVAAAVTSAGAVAEAGTVAGELLGDRRHWPADVTWRTFGDALICEDDHSPRSLTGGLNPAELVLVTAAFR